MAFPNSERPIGIISPSEMEVVEHVLGMSTGYLLDFSDRSFDQFIAHEVGVDATAPRFSADGGSKAKRFRRILHSLPANQQAKLLKALLAHRDSPVRSHSMSLLDDEWRTAYDQVITHLESRVASADNQVAQADIQYSASSWTGRRTVREQIAIVRGLAPLAIRELDDLASLVDAKRFNDPVTADAVQCLRDLHDQIGELLSAIDRGAMTRSAVEAIEANRKRLIRYMSEGAKLGVVAPAMTFGVMHILSWLTGVPIDSTMVAGVFGSIVGADALKSFGKSSSVAGVSPVA